MTSSTTTSAFESAIVGFVASLDDLQVDATRDAFEICRAMIDVDGMLTDEELLRFVEVFAPKIPGLQTKTPAELRRSKFFRGPGPSFSSRHRCSTAWWGQTKPTMGAAPPPT